METSSPTYQLTLEERPSYLHARATGTHTERNAQRLLAEVQDACVKLGHTAVLLELDFSGPSLATSSIYKIVSQSSPAAAKLRRVAYVDRSARDPDKMKFAETVALNRGVNVRLFRDIESAQRWISGAAGGSPA